MCKFRKGGTVGATFFVDMCDHEAGQIEDG